MSPYIDIHLQFQCIDENHNDFATETRIKVETGSSFEKIRDFEEIRCFETLIHQANRNCQEKVHYT